MLDLDMPMLLTMGEIACPSATTNLLTERDERGEVIGYLSLRHYDDAWLVADVFTLQGYREQGVGTRLLEQAIEVSEESELDLVLRVAGSGAPDTRSDAELLAWYQRHGFNTHPEWAEPTVLIRRFDG